MRLNTEVRKANMVSQVENLVGGLFCFEETIYINNKKPIKVRCIKHGEFTTTPSNLVRKPLSCCPGCQKKFTKDDFIRHAKAKHGDFYSYDRVVFKNTATDVIITCPRHGDFKQNPYSHYAKGTKCPKCALEDRSLDRDKFLTKSKSIHEDKYSYDKVGAVKNNLTKVIITCPKHGDFEQAVRSHLAGNGCGECSIDSTKLGKETFVREARKIHGDKYSYDKVIYTRSKVSVTITCPKHGDFQLKPNLHLSSRQGCPRCNYSKGEEYICRLLESWAIEYVKEYKLADSNFRFDFYLPKYNALIEYHGQQHYREVTRFGGHMAYVRLRKRDSDKIALAVNGEFEFIQLDFIDMNLGVLEQRLKERLKIIDRDIFK